MKTKFFLGLAAVAIGSALATPTQAGMSLRIGAGLPCLPLPRIVVTAPAPCPPQVVYTPVPECVFPVPFRLPQVVIVRPQPFWGSFGHYESLNHERHERYEHAERYGHGRHGDRR